MFGGVLPNTGEQFQGVRDGSPVLQAMYYVQDRRQQEGGPETKKARVDSWAGEGRCRTGFKRRYA